MSTIIVSKSTISSPSSTGILDASILPAADPILHILYYCTMTSDFLPRMFTCLVLSSTLSPYFRSHHIIPSSPLPISYQGVCDICQLVRGISYRSSYSPMIRFSQLPRNRAGLLQRLDSQQLAAPFFHQLRASRTVPRAPARATRRSASRTPVCRLHSLWSTQTLTGLTTIEGVIVILFNCLQAIVPGHRLAGIDFAVYLRTIYVVYYLRTILFT